MLEKIKKNWFFFEELVKRDFKQKYKRTVLGVGWSLLSPLLQLLVMSIVFKKIFGRTMEYYTIYLFCGNLIFSYFKEATKNGMNALMANAKIISKINVPKYMFLLSQNVSTLINFGLTLVILFVFCVIDKIQFGWHFVFLTYPVACLVVFNVGIGLILSALFVFFRDISYLYDIFTLLVMYMSATFYTVDILSETLQKVLLCNPVYCYIKYFRMIILDGTIPSLAYHIWCLFFAVLALGVGALVYKKKNHYFLYYL